MRILMIEDVKDLCQNITLTLNQSGIQTECCHTGSDGLYLAKHHPYDAIILDRMLPEIDGLTVLETLRRHNNTTPIILPNDLDRLHPLIDGMDAGADE